MNCLVQVLSIRLKEQQAAQSSADHEPSEADSDDAQSSCAAAPSESATAAAGSSAARVRELEAELRIAKEVSFRLHKELEGAEEKRYKLEEEVFYYKDKVREIQTQNKWRDSRRTDNTPVGRERARTAFRILGY